MEKVFITGADGFLAQHLTKLLVNKGYHVVGMINPEQSNNPLKNKIEYFRGDLKNINTFKDKVPKRGIVIHCYSLSPGAHASKKVYFKENILSTKNVLQACKERKIKRLIYISSCSINSPKIGKMITEKDAPSPDNLYSKSKLKAETFVNKFYKDTKIPTLILRVPTIYGEGMHIRSATMKFFRYMHWPFFGVIKKGNNLYEFSYVKNVAYGILQSFKIREGYDLFIISDIKKIKFIQAAKTIANYVNPSVKFISISLGFALFLGTIGDIITSITCKRFPFRVRTAKNMAGGLVFDPSKAVKSFGLKQQYSLDEGIKNTVKWLKKEKII